MTVWINDTAGNKNTSSVTFIIDTIAPPISIAVPSNHTNTSNTGQDVNYSVLSADRHSCWYSNDTMGVNTTLASCANITTITWGKGEHNVTVWNNDTAGNKNSSTIRFTIDLTPPTFTTIANQTIESNDALGYDIDASDTYGVDCFTVNDTTNFQINCSGYLQNNTALSVNVYWINITVNDSHSNENSSLMKINVTSQTSSAINFVTPTPANLTAQSTTNVEINVSITESDLSELTYNWNGTNYTMYNDSMILMMNFDNVSALGENNTYVVDLSGNDDNGTVNGATWNNSGKYSGTYDFDGTSSDYITISDSPRVRLVDNFTIGVWVYSNNPSNSGRIYNKESSTNGLSNYILDIANNKIRFQFNDLTPITHLGVANITSQTWYHIMITYSSNTLTSYLNGTLDNVSTHSGTIGTSSNPFYIGRFDDQFNQNFNGSIDELRIWNRTLSAAEVYQQYASNLRKYNTNKWSLYVNQSKNATTGLVEGNYTYQVFSLNSENNKNSTGPRTVIIDTIAPTVSIAFPTNSTNHSNTGLNINYSVSDQNTISCWYSNDTMGVNTTLANCANITTITWEEGKHNVTIWVNDTAGNKNTTNVTFIIDTIPPTISIAIPSNYTNTSNTNQDINYSVSNPGRHSCWYSNDTMGVNTTLATCANITTITWAEGEHNVTVWVNDTTGNKNSSTIRFTIDLTSPTFTNLSNQTVEYGNALTYDLNSSDTVLFDCFSVNDTTNFKINCSGYLENNTNLSVNLYWLNITVNDTSNNQNSTLLQVNVNDTTSPTIILNNPAANLINDSVNVTNVTFNCSVTDLSNLFNISLYITNSSNTSFALNQTTNITRLSNSSNWSLSLPTGNYTWNCLGYDTYNNSAWASTNRTITIGFVDNDGDSVSDSLDLLEGNETNVNTTGLTSLNITISGNSTTGSYSDEQEIVFYDSSEKIVNFTHNFSSSQLDLSKVRVIKATNSIIINLSGQVQANYNKTVYITDNNFASLCVKDAEVNSIDNITSLCTGTNETDLTTCLGSSANLNNLNCSDLGSTIEIKNLRHSAIRGVPRSTQTTTPASSGGSGGGGSFSGGIASQITKECTNNSDCKPKYNCWNEKCVMLFDVRIIKFISPIETSKVINFTYLIKGKGYVKGDVIINYWLEKNNQILSQGKDTVYLDEYEEKGLIASLPLPTNTSEEPYLLYVSVDYQSYKTKASRTIEIKEDKVIAQPLTSPKKKVIPILLEKINLAGFLIILLIIFTINETINVFWHKDKEIKQKKIKQPIIPKEKPKSKTDKSKTSEGKELIKGLLKATLNKSEKESNIKEYESEDQEEENYYYEDIEDIEEISQL